MNHTTAFCLPFTGKWFVLWGGETEKQNYHRKSVSQRSAFDFVVHDDRAKTHVGKGSKNQDYYAFGKDVLAPAAGEVIEVIGGVRDNDPGQTNGSAAGGNTLLIKHAAKEFSVIAHMQYESVQVRAGDQVVSGQKLGLCGNSGNSSEPHIHYHLQTSDVLSKFTPFGIKPIAKGIKIYFSDISFDENDGAHDSALYSPVRGDNIGNMVAYVK